MSQANVDRRVERTRNALAAAFVELMLSRGYDDVTVEDVAARANVGRSTFYLHFRGREDILSTSLVHPSQLLAALVGKTVTVEQLVPLLVHFREQRRLNRVLFDQPVRAIWIKCLAKLIEPGLKTMSRRNKPALPLALIAAHIAESQIALVARWLSLCPHLEPAPIAEALIATTRANLLALLGER